MPDVTVVIPCAPYHEDVVHRAIQSVEAQTIPCHVVWAIDKQGVGPGVIRNRLMDYVETPYTVFLDADDWLDPSFAEECVRVIRPGRYVYTDWYYPENYRHAPEFPYCYRAFMERTWHMITALLYTEDVRQVGGFDESLAALEDTDFWLKITREIGTCGIHIRKALAYYGKEGRRAQKAIDNNYERDLLNEILERYTGPMPCCGEYPEVNDHIPIGERQPNDVLARPLWRGNNRVRGVHSGRMYPRISWPKTTWVDPKDIELAPAHWQWEAVDQPAVGDNGQSQALDVFDQFFHKPMAPTEPLSETQVTIPPTLPPEFTPDVETIVRIARKRLSR